MRGLVRGAPLTCGWLVLLLVTTIVQRTMPHGPLEHLLRMRSTNLANLSRDPITVLVTSLFWLDGVVWLPYAVAFVVFLAPAERWLGRGRWLVVGLAGHVGATFASQLVLARLILDRRADPSLVHATDVGVSYFLAAIIGVLTYRFVRPWRLAWALLVVGVPATALALHPTFTATGHLLAVLIGLAMVPATWDRDAPLWDPGVVLGRLVRSRPEATRP